MSKIPSAILATGLVTLGIIIAQCGVILDTIVKQHKENFEHEFIKYQEIETIKQEIKNK